MPNKLTKGGQPVDKGAGVWKRAIGLIQHAELMRQRMIPIGERKEPDYEISSIYSGLQGQS